MVSDWDSTNSTRWRPLFDVRVRAAALSNDIELGTKVAYFLAVLARVAIAVAIAVEVATAVAIAVAIAANINSSSN